MAAATVLTLAGCLVGRGRRCGGPLRGAAHAGRDFAGRALHVGCCLRDRGDDALDVGLEAVGHLALQGLLLEFGLLLGSLLRLAHAARLDHAPAEHVDRAGHGAEFIAALAAGDRDVDFAAGKAVHDRRDGGQWPRQPPAEQQRQQDRADQDGDRAEDQAALRTRRRRLVLGRILDDFENADRLAGVILDLPEIERGGPAADRGVAAQRLAVEHALQLARRRDHFVAEGRGQLLEVLAVERIDRKVDAEALLGAFDEFLAEGGADVDIGQRLAVAHDRRHAEDRKRLATGLDADDGLAGPDRFDHGGTPRGSIVVEHLRRMDAVDGHRRRPPERDQRDALRLHRLHGLAEQPASPSRSPFAMASATGGRAAITDDTASAARPS